jgi:hypothetical protein
MGGGIEMETYEVTRDGRTLATFRTEAQAWSWLQQHQPFSIGHAVAHEGYDIIYPNGTGLKGIEMGA